MLLTKGVYPSRFLDEEEIVDETLLSEKVEFYTNLNMKVITDSNCNFMN